MLKRLVLWTAFAVFVGALATGAIIRTRDRTALAQGQDHGIARGQEVSATSQGQGRGNGGGQEAAGQGQGQDSPPVVKRQA